MKTSEQPSPSAQEAYERNHAETYELILRIASKIEANYNANKPKDWADVGSLAHVKEQLTNIAEFIGA